MTRKAVHPNEQETAARVSHLKAMLAQEREAFLNKLKDGAPPEQLYTIRNNIRRLNEQIEQAEHPEHRQSKAPARVENKDREHISIRIGTLDNPESYGLGWHLEKIKEQIELLGKPYCPYDKNDLTGKYGTYFWDFGGKEHRSKLANYIFTSPCLHHLSPHVKIEWITHGVEKKALLDLKNLMELDLETMGEILSITKRTIQNKNPDDKFDTSVSEKLVVLSEVYTYGLEVFEDSGKFLRWFNKPNLALGEKAPIELANTVMGMQEIKNELGRIEHGIY